MPFSRNLKATAEKSPWSVIREPLDQAVISSLTSTALLSPQAGGLKMSAAPENTPGYAFAKNTTASGNPVTLCYGKRRVGGAIISADLCRRPNVTVTGASCWSLEICAHATIRISLFLYLRACSVGKSCRAKGACRRFRIAPYLAKSATQRGIRQTQWGDAALHRVCSSQKQHRYKISGPTRSASSI